MRCSCQVSTQRHCKLEITTTYLQHPPKTRPIVTNQSVISARDSQQNRETKKAWCRVPRTASASAEQGCCATRARVRIRKLLVQAQLDAHANERCRSTPIVWYQPHNLLLPHHADQSFQTGALSGLTSSLFLQPCNLLFVTRQTSSHLSTVDLIKTRLQQGDAAKWALLFLARTTLTHFCPDNAARFAPRREQ